MILNKVIVHELKKLQHKGIEPSNFRPLVLNNEHPLVLKLVEDVTKIYGNRYNGAHYGTFVDGEGRGTFPDEFDNYTKLDNPTDLNFIKISHIAMHRLYDKASSSPLASGGYILFSDYISEGTRFFLIVMIKKAPGMRLSEDLIPEELEQLDLNKLHQAAKINLRKLAEWDAAGEERKRELNYLSFISPASSKSASGYFITALGCSEGHTSNRATANLIRGSRVFFKQRPDIAENKDAFMSSLYAYLYEKLGNKEPVRLAEVSNIVSRHMPAELGDRAQELLDEYVTLLNDDDLAIPVEFPVSKSTLKRQTHVTAKAKNWQFVFDKLALGASPASEIYYNRKQGTLQINALTPEIIEQLEKELEEEQPDDGEEGNGEG